MNEHGKRFIALMDEFGLNKGQASRMLSRATGSDISHRRIRTWTTTTAKHPSSRADCPAWAVVCLLVALTIEGHIAPDDLFARIWEFY